MVTFSFSYSNLSLVSIALVLLFVVLLIWCSWLYTDPTISGRKRFIKGAVSYLCGLLLCLSSLSSVIFSAQDKAEPQQLVHSNDITLR